MNLRADDLACMSDQQFGVLKSRVESIFQRPHVKGRVVVHINAGPANRAEASSSTPLLFYYAALIAMVGVVFIWMLSTKL